MTDTAKDGIHYRLGTWRTRPPAETLGTVLRVADRAGVTRLANITHLDRIGLPVVMAIRPASRGLSVWMGKGLQLDGARASGLMEAVETFCAEQTPRRGITAAAAEFGRGEAIGRLAALPRHPGARLDRRAPLRWVAGRDLFSGAAVWVPRGAVTVDFGSAHRRDPFWSNTNGLASGNTRDEALLHGLCEVIERDAFSLWQHLSPQRRRPTQLDLAAVEDTACREALARLAAARIDAWAFDVTSDIGVPAYLCIIDDRDGHHPRLGRFGGTGCHPSAALALFRAIAEAIQSRLGFIAGAREDIPLENYATIGGLVALASHLEALPPPRAGHRRLRRALLHAEGIAEAVTAVTARLRACRIAATTIVDIPSAPFGVPVLRIVAPDLEDSYHRPLGAAGRRLRGLRR